MPACSFLGIRSSVSHQSPTSSLRLKPPPIRTSRVVHVTTAVLDTPASNTYLQRHAEATLRDFLTRRAVNTVQYYMHELGDGPGRTWLRNFDAFDEKVQEDKFTDGDAYLDRMSRAQNEKGVLRIGNSRLSRKYNFTIEPHRIAKRITDVRLQLAEEWAKDLGCIKHENLEIQRLGFEKMLCSSEKELNSKRNLVFDSDPFTTDHTPLRYKNYKALKTLITGHAVARLLPYTRDCGSNHEYMYLLQFMNSYGAIKDGDELVRMLMERPIEYRTNPEFVIQPKGIALQIMELRQAIAEEWISVMEFIPGEQNLRTRSILENSMKISDAIGEDVRKPQSGIDDSESITDKGTSEQA